jgi:hypothetical protein
MTITLFDEPRPVADAATAPSPRTEVATAAPAQVAATSPMTIKQAAIALIREREPEVLALVEKYRGVALDLSTPKALAAGRAQRTEVREKGRLAVQRDRDGLKDVLNAAKKEAEAEADRLIALVKPVEDHLQAQIDAREKVLADEKAERERIAAEAAAAEAARVAAHRANIAKIRGYVAQAQGATAAKLAAAIDFLRTVPVDESYQEFQAEAEAARAETLQALQTMHGEAQAREAEAERVRLQAEENARVAAAQAAEAQRLAQERAALEAQAAELKRQQEAAAKAEAQSLADGIRAESRRVEWPKNPAYIRKAMGTFECMAPDWENDPRQVVREAVAEGRQYLAGLLAEALRAEEAAQAAAAAAQAAQAPARVPMAQLFAPQPQRELLPAQAPGTAALHEDDEPDAHEEPRRPELPDLPPDTITPVILAGTPGCASAVVVAGDDGTPPWADGIGIAAIRALLDHIDSATVGQKFPTQPKVPAAWWSDLRGSAAAVRRLLDAA